METNYFELFGVPTPEPAAEGGAEGGKDPGKKNKRAWELIEKTEKEHPDVKVICATEREPHGKTVKQIFEKLPERLPEEKSGETMSKEKMRTRLKTQEGQKIYSKRKTTVEPVFGIIKRVMGFRQFLMRGLENIGIEWDLVTISYNVSRMYAR